MQCVCHLINGQIVTNEIPGRKVVRNKGKNMLQFPDSYTVIDIETTGLSTEYDKIIEVSAVKCINNKIVENYSSLIQPDDFEDFYEDNDGDTYLPDFITSLTGITDEMLKSAPPASDVLSHFVNFIGDSVLIGHNVNFDINFLYDNILDLFGTELSNDFVDTMRISRRINSELDHHRLSDLAELFSLDYINAHRSLNDCLITQACYLKLRQKIIKKYGDEESFLKECNIKKNNSPRACEFNVNIDANKNSPIYGKVFVFTGRLERMTRKDAMRLVSDLGGQLGDGVTKKTDFLILGNNDYCSTIKDGKSSKQKKAEKLKQDGYDIEIIPEDVFYEMISEEF